MRRVRVLLPLLAMLAALPGCTHQAAVPSTGAAAAVSPPANIRPSLSLKWFDAAGQIKWPPHDGCAGAEVAQTVPAGTLLDRFGSEGGSFFSPRGASFASRALPYVCSKMAYTVYRVLKPLPVKECKAAAWFGEPGGAKQFQTAEPAYKLRSEGFIVMVSDDSSRAGGATSPCGSP